MKKFDFKSSMQRKKNLKYGGYATVSTIVLLIALVLVNVLFTVMDFDVDLTVEGIYTPSEETLAILDQVEDDVIIYGLYNTGTEQNEYNKRVINLIEAYTDLSDHVSFKLIDPLTDPAFVNGFLADDSVNLENGSLIMVNQATGKFKTILLSSMYEITTDYSLMTRSITGFSAEVALSSALQYVCITDTPVLYQLTGHSERALTSAFINYLSYTNYEVDSLHLILENVTELEANEYSVILVNNPRLDITEDEYQILLSFMERGGRMLFLASSDMPELPNFERLLQRYGISIQRGLMIETSANHYYQYPYVIRPEMGTDNPITQYMQDVNNDMSLIVAPASVVINNERNNNTRVNAIVTTSEDAVIKGDDNNAAVYEEGDIQGPFNLAVLAEETVNRPDGNVTGSKLMVVGSSDFIDAENNGWVFKGNYQLATLMCDYLQDSVTRLYINTKDISESKIATTQGDFIFYGLMFVVVIPLIVIMIGVIIWVRRKHL